MQARTIAAAARVRGRDQQPHSGRALLMGARGADPRTQLWRKVSGLAALAEQLAAARETAGPYAPPARGDSLENNPAGRRAGHASIVVGSTIFFICGRNGDAFYTDMVSFDTATGRWDRDYAPVPFAGRAYHTATLVGNEIVVVGGSTLEHCCEDVWAFRPAHRTWRQLDIRDPHNLLMRTAHCAVLHPTAPHALLLFAGYGGRNDALAYRSDLLLLRLDRRTVEVVAASGAQPEVRAYHSMTLLGDPSGGGARCVVVGGRNDGGLILAREAVAVYEFRANRWVAPARCISGLAPASRSSHKAVAVGSGMLLFGGAARDKERLNDMHWLGPAASALSRLEWIQAVPSGARQPSVRAAFSLDVVGAMLFLAAGYGDLDRSERRGRKVSGMMGDIWALPMPTIAGQASLDASQYREDSLAAPAAPQAMSPRGEASGWQSKKREPALVATAAAAPALPPAKAPIDVYGAAAAAVADLDLRRQVAEMAAKLQAQERDLRALSEKYAMLEADKRRSEAKNARLAGLSGRLAEEEAARRAADAAAKRATDEACALTERLQASQASRKEAAARVAALEAEARAEARRREQDAADAAVVARAAERDREATEAMRNKLQEALATSREACKDAEDSSRRHERARQEADDAAAASARAAREASSRAADAERQCQAACAEADKLTADLGAQPLSAQVVQLQQAQARYAALQQGLAPLQPLEALLPALQAGLRALAQDAALRPL
ncbi:hypothetical protein WJX81_000216 [Elliptochloris bilobata]|uniref:Uncharacterized protein n=1 Tax=Elliptochloris bilobata TaxID=381761 RepID=A0AAW1REX3_9CHLO